MKKIDRRQLLALALATTGGIVAHNLWQKRQPINIISWANPSHRETQVYQSKNGLLEVDLTAGYSPVTIDNKTFYLLTYNGQIPAPRLEAKAGDKVKIRFTNKLNQPTNIHYHGLHISPQGKADNVFLEIQPNQTFLYEFTIPDNHDSITAWYHPHLHGYVAEQLSGGLAGLFIIRRELDEIPEIKSAQEEFLVLQDFAVDNNGRLINSQMLPLMMGREGDLITVNGKINPSFRVSQGQLLRLRILNASTSRFYNLSLENNPFYLIATDGRAIDSPQQMTQLLLTPGQRAEILVQGENNLKQLRLLDLPYDRGGMGMMGGGMMGGGMMRRGRDYNYNSPNILATINFNSDSQKIKPISLPTKLASITSLPTPSRVRSFTLNHGMAPRMGMVFLINGQPYDHQRIDTKVKLNTVEEWELINTGVMDHPFHIHVNSFQVISRNGVPESYSAWRDTVLVPRGERVKIRLKFADFTGKTVYHCHILDHEDLGMMGNLLIG
jgi:FtsP/CotA-like multicopper oxidase with cupredoxin domain